MRVPSGSGARRLRVLQLVSLAAGTGGARGAGGPEIRTAESLRYWDPGRLEIHVAYSSAGQLIDEFRNHPHWIDFVVTNHARLATLRRLQEIIVGREIDVVHTQGPVYTDFVATVAARRTGIRNVVTRAVQIGDFRVSPLRKQAFLLMDRYTKRRCSAMVAISGTGLEGLRAEGCPPGKIRIVYNGVDTDRFSPQAAPTIDKAPGEFVIAMFAQMVAHKRHDVLLDVLRRAVDAGRNWRLLLAGDGPLRKDLERRADEVGLAARVTFLGFRRDLAGIYASADVVALASEREGFPVTLLEGMASGRACVASAVAGVGELFDAGAAGVVVGHNAAEDFFAAIASLEDDRNRLATLAQRGRERAVERFSIEAMVKGYTDIYLHDNLRTSAQPTH